LQIYVQLFGFAIFFDEIYKSETEKQ